MSIRVLVIDESPVVRGAAERSLIEAGYEAISAADGREGLRVWREVHPDLVVADIMMPQRDGIETIMSIRRQQPGAAILATTCFSHGGTIDFPGLLRRLGADDVLAKPFAPETLLEKVDRLSAPTLLKRDAA